MKRSVRLEALAVMIPIVIVAMVTLSIFSYVIAKEIIQTSVQNKMQLNLSSAVEKVQISLDKNQKVAELLARAFESTSDVMKEDNIQNALLSFVNTNSETFGAGIWYEPYKMFPAQKYFSRYSMRKDGKVVYVPDYSLGPGVYYNTQDWYTDVENTKQSAVWSSPYYDDVAKISMVTASVPLYDKSGKFIGVSTTDMDLTQLQKAVASIQPTAGSAAFLVDNSGTYIANDDSSKLLKMNIKKEKDASLAKIGETMLSQKSGSGEYQLNGSSYGIWYSQIPGCNWTIAISAPENVLYADLYALSRKLALICILATVLLSSLLILFVNFRIINPLKQLETASKKISDGDLSVRISANSRNEFGSVTEAMQATVSRLHSYIDYISELSTALNQIADGNLDFSLHLDYSGEFSKLKVSIERIRNSFTDMLQQIHVTAKKVSASASSVSGSAQALAQGTTEQAGTIEELTATVRDISEQVRKNAETSSYSSDNAKKIEQEVLASDRKMRSMLQAMTQISDSSNQIGKIIKNIEDIAFQTNILALNAAVEAARAGVAGKGFAVVADEVRNLASKSTEAAHNTTELIQSSISSVENGTKILNDTASSLSLAVGNIQGVSQSIDQISSATIAQADAISQVAQGLEQISSVVQLTSATSEKSASASTELSLEAQDLFQQISHFKVADTGAL